eukprot:14182525-Alexandrium_andersonii.AAC.1
MSASLVGSEMCIRDSSGRAAQRTSPDRGRRTTSPALRSLNNNGVDQAVSYTHLTLPTICSV